MAPRRRNPNDDGEWNTPEEMRARAAYLLFLASLPGGLLLTIAGALTHRPLLLLGGMAAFAAGWGAWDWLRRRERFTAVANALDSVPMIGAQAEETHLVRLVGLLREWDQLEQRRGMPGFDPWAVQAVRNDILAIVEKDPALESLFHGHRRAA